MTPAQIIFIGILASAFTFLLRILATYLNIHPGRLVVNIVLFLVSAGVAIAWTHPVLPPLTSDIGAYVAALFQLAAPVVSVATLVYNALYSQVIVPAWARFAAKPKG